jgi:hypothetical protein
VFERSANALAHLANSLRGTDRDILTSGRSALADGPSCIDRMQRDEIDGPFASTLRDISSTLGGTNAYRTRTSADFPRGSALVLLVMLRLGGQIPVLPLAARVYASIARLASSTESHDETQRNRTLRFECRHDSRSYLEDAVEQQSDSREGKVIRTKPFWAAKST